MKWTALALDGTLIVLVASLCAHLIVNMLEDIHCNRRRSVWRWKTGD